MTTSETAAQLDLAKVLEVSVELAYTAGKMALEVRRKSNAELGIENKIDETPVTEADTMLNEFITSKLLKEFPQARAIGEESIKNETKDLSIGYVFFVDPIDGTKEFIKNNGEWAVMIGLCNNGVPILGVVYRAAADKLYYGVQGQGAYVLNGADRQTAKKIQSRNVTEVPDAVIVLSRSNSYPEVDAFMTIANVTKTTTMGSFGVKCCMLSEGDCDIYYNPGRNSHFWDSCAGDIILQESGATLLTQDGNRIVYQGLQTKISDNVIAFPLSLPTPVVVDAVKQSVEQAKQKSAL